VGITYTPPTGSGFGVSDFAKMQAACQARACSGGVFEDGKMTSTYGSAVRQWAVAVGIGKCQFGSEAGEWNDSQLG
jgi:hypothetical protein